MNKHSEETYRWWAMEALKSAAYAQRMKLPKAAQEWRYVAAMWFRKSAEARRSS